MKKRIDLKLSFKKERIAKLNDLHMIKGGTGDCGTGQTIIPTTSDPKVCLPTLVTC